MGSENIFVVCDRNVETLARSLAPGRPLLAIVADEEHKDMDTVLGICRWLLECGADRDAVVYAVGGGVTTDMAGFAASIYKRGVRYVNYPTTLLCQVDAGIGGKTGVNLDGYKNILGVINFPLETRILPQALETLPERELRSGAAEMLKTFIIKDGGNYRKAVEALSRDKVDTDELAPLIEAAAQVKREIVAQDPTEKGLRRVLNLGHTFAHAIEWYQHGHTRPAAAAADDQGLFKVFVVSPEQIVKASVEEEIDSRLTRTALDAWVESTKADPEIERVMEEQFAYQYPYPASRQQKMKFTVSELKKRSYVREDQAGDDAFQMGELLYEEPDVVPLLPRFLQKEDVLTGASRGTAYHRVMELLDFAGISDLETVKAAMEGYQEEGKLSGDMKEAVRPEDILEFLQCPCGRRMREADKIRRLYREQPFVLGIDAREIYPGEQEGEILLVQGIIDAYFEEDGELVVVDYKTDRVSSGQELEERYHAQLEYYARALEQLTGKKVKEKIIYSFALKKELSLS